MLSTYKINTNTSRYSIELSVWTELEMRYFPSWIQLTGWGLSVSVLHN
jgi:hypothetical protein